MASIETRNVRLLTVVFSMKFIKSVVSISLRFDFRDFDIGCSNVHLSTKIFQVSSDEGMGK